jgi:hypothetical protein
MMGIYIAAAIASATAVAICGVMALRVTETAHRRALLLAFLVMLPMQPLAFYAVRVPVLGYLTPLLGGGIAMLTVMMLAAPLTEEPAKWLVLAVAPVRRAILECSAMGMAIATGLGFGIGEIWFLAEQVARVAAYQSLPFTQFGGFMIERTQVCLLHGFFLAPMFYALARGRHVVFGALIGVVAHLLTNLPILAVQSDLFGLGRERWLALVNLWLIVLIVVGLLAVNRFSGRRLFIRRASAS